MTFVDFEGRTVILTAFAGHHILTEHYEIGELGLHRVIEETLASPDVVVRRNRALHYFRMRPSTQFGDKYARVVVTEEQGTRYVRTAFVTGRIVKGEVVWERET